MPAQVISTLVISDISKVVAISVIATRGGSISPNRYRYDIDIHDPKYRLYQYPLMQRFFGLFIYFILFYYCQQSGQ